jgi:hypothetical protein
MPTGCTTAITNMEIVTGTNLYNYTPTDKNSRFLKIYVVSPRLFTACMHTLPIFFGKIVNCKAPKNPLGQKLYISYNKCWSGLHWSEINVKSSLGIYCVSTIHTIATWFEM